MIEFNMECGNGLLGIGNIRTTILSVLCIPRQGMGCLEKVE